MADNWRRVQRAFHKALELPADERTAFIASFCDKHPDDAKALQELLNAATLDDDFLRSPIESAVTAARETVHDSWIGSTVGQYVIKRRIATGGMGSVFLAQRQSAEFDQDVAVKLMNSRVLGPEAVQRFRVERQILANLSHPNIAALIDGGTTDEGVPFLVMPYIDSVPIDAYCNTQKLTVRERLELVLRVGAAVTYAHQNLVVHRDLKPSNIVVDQRGDPQLLDFGIAKLLEGNALDESALTRDGARALTPECASPEQVRGEPVSVATDVYALGVLMFRLLTGRSPYAATTHSPYELAQAIVSDDPRRPSTVVTEPTQEDVSSSIDVGVAFSATPELLRKSLAGDLDNIILKSLQKDPERRYSSVAAQMQDIRNYLEKRPILARPDSFWYRTRKFVARNTVAVVATISTMSGIVGLTAFYTQRLAEERDIAQQESEAARQVTDFLVDVFAATRAGRKDAETVTVREVLDRGADKVDDSLGEQPLIHARVLQHIARTYASIARYDDAEARYLQARDIFERETGASTETASAHRQLANVQLSFQRWQRAQDYYLEALELYRAQRPQDGKAIAEVLRLLVYTQSRLGDNDGAQAYLDEMLPIIEREYGPEDPAFANGLYSKASLLREQGQMQAARDAAAQALQIVIAHDGEDAPRTVNYRHLLGLVDWDLGHFEEALTQYQRGIAIRSSYLREDHPSLFNITYSLATTYEKLERYGEAADVYDRLIGWQIAALGADNSTVAFSRAGYGMTLLKLQRMDAAEEQFQDAIAALEAEYGADHYDLDVSVIGLGHVARARGDTAQARQHYERAITLRETYRGERHPMTANVLSSLGELELEMGQLDTARAIFQRVLSVHEDPAHPNEQSRLKTLEWLAKVERAAIGEAAQ
ncbi:MAG: serine/threonine-protein kinase [Pseudomonadota bacterium]